MTAPAPPTAEALVVDALTVAYGRHRAVDAVSVAFAAGAVHGLLGANGSGKSSLLKALAGVSQGRVRGDVTPPRATAPHQRVDAAAAHAMGLRFVHQDLGLVDEVSILDNMFLGGHRPARLAQIRWRASRELAAGALRQVGLEHDLRTPVTELRASERVLLAVARALMDLPATGGFLFLDEPTAGLDERDSDELLTYVRGLAASREIGIVFVTHRIREVERFTDSVTVLRDGVVVERFARGQLDVPRLVAALGGTLAAAGPEAASEPVRAGVLAGDPLALELDGLAGDQLAPLTVGVRRGEIFGVTGLEGSGKHEIVELLYGQRRPSGGTVRFAGRPLVLRTPAEAVAAGIGLVPADRVAAGGIPELTVQENLLLPGIATYTGGGRFHGRAARDACTEALRRFRVVPQEPGRPFGSLSGGNQQKVIVGRWLLREPTLLLLHEPTAGVDVAAREFLWQEIRNAAASGMTVVVVSSDIAEVASLCDRVAVLVDGRLSGLLERSELTADRVLAASLLASWDEASDPETPIRHGRES